MGYRRQGRGGPRPRGNRPYRARFARSFVGRGRGRPCGRFRRGHSALVWQQDQGRHRDYWRLRRLRKRLKRSGGKAAMIIRVLDPTNEAKLAGGQSATRPATLKGKTVGFISNGKEGTKGYFAQ